MFTARKQELNHDVILKMGRVYEANLRDQYTLTGRRLHEYRPSASFTGSEGGRLLFYRIKMARQPLVDILKVTDVVMNPSHHEPLDCSMFIYFGFRILPDAPTRHINEYLVYFVTAILSMY